MHPALSAVFGLIALAMILYAFRWLALWGDGEFEGSVKHRDKALDRERAARIRAVKLVEQAEIELRRYLDPLDEPNRENTRVLVERMQQETATFYRALEKGS